MELFELGRAAIMGCIGGCIALVVIAGVRALWKASGTVTPKWKAKSYLNSANAERVGVYKKGRITGIWWKQTELYDFPSARYYITCMSKPKVEVFYDEDGDPKV